MALVTELMRKLAETRPTLKSSVVAVFIANEENSSICGVGVDALVKEGLLDKLRDGPLYVISSFFIFVFFNSQIEIKTNMYMMIMILKGFGLTRQTSNPA